MTRNKELAHKYFANDTPYGVVGETYKIVDDPYLGYQIHLNKLSCRWRPLFQKHKAFKTWNELEVFVLAHYEDVEFFDEFKNKYTFYEYKDTVFKHIDTKSYPYKWVYDYYDGILSGAKNQKLLYLKECEPEEVDIWSPFEHGIYFKTERDAQKRFGVSNYEPVFNYWSDPDYMFDWTDGNFL